MKQTFKTWFRSGEPYIWLNAGTVSLSLIMVVGLIVLIGANGLSHFWPKQVAEFNYLDEFGTTTRLMGEFSDEEIVPRARMADGDQRVSADQQLIERYLIKTGNRDYVGLDFRWLLGLGISDKSYPEDIMVVERLEWGNFYGYLLGVKEHGELINTDGDLWEVFQDHIEEAVDIYSQIRHIEKDLIGKINYKMERLRLKEKGLKLDNITAPEPYREIDEERNVLQAEYDEHIVTLGVLYEELGKGSFIARLADGQEVEIEISKVVRAFQPNAMSLPAKFGFYFEKLWEFMSAEPREANTEGGIFPAIFGTVMMVMVMAILVTPFGVVAAVYLREYATQGPVTRLIRIAVNNLAGVPSVVYGVFGLGFFVYFLGGSIDELLFSDALPTPTFGTPGLMWASLTLAILTVPVVIVATEEGLSRVPRAIREGSLALGATKAETLWLTVLPMTASAMMTGLILAVARAAGEVAPLMLVGVVKLAPSLPLDGNFPYLHMERKFMHLGFHIYDVGFQSPNVEAARPLVYATAFLLVLIIIFLNLAAIRIRNKLREKYRAAEQH